MPGFLGYGQFAGLVQKVVVVSESLTTSRWLDASSRNRNSGSLCGASKNAFDGLAINFRAVPFPDRNHKDDDLLVYDLIHETIA